MDDWMTAADAVAAVRQHLTYQNAGFAIARRAHEGLIQTKATRISWGNRRLDNAVIDPSFWWAGGHAAMFCDWTCGDFDTTISPANDPAAFWCYFGRGPVHVKAFGVMFSRAGIDDLLPEGAGAGFGTPLPASKATQENVHGPGAAWAALLALWCSEAKRSYERDRDRVNSECSKAGRMQSDAHIRLMSEAAEGVTIDLLGKARAQGILPENYGPAKDAARALFDELAADVSSVAVGKSGRMPQPDNAAVADRVTSEAWDRIAAEVIKWSLVDALAAQPMNVVKMEGTIATIKPRRGRKPGSGSMANADAPLLQEMADLIATGRAFSPDGAAKLVASKAAGAATVDNKANRLAKRFRSEIK